MPFFVSKEEMSKPVEELQEELYDVKAQLADARTAGEGIKRVLTRIRDLKESGQLDEDAHSAALFELEQEYRAKITDGIKKGLKESMREATERDLRVTKGPEIRKELDELFQTDGTYAMIRDEVLSTLRHETSDKLTSEFRAKTQAELVQPDERAALIESLMAEMKMDGTFDKIRAEVTLDLQKQWADEARDELIGKITAELEAGEAEYKAEKTDQMLASTAYTNTRAAKRKELQKKWDVEINDALAIQAGDEELAALVEERKLLERSRIQDVRTEIESERLKRDFNGKGFDMAQVAEGTRLSIHLGHIKAGRLRVSERNSNFSGRRGQVNEVKRAITLIATGDKGHFRVEADSLSKSESVYERQMSIEPGTIIMVGRTQKKNGKEEFRHSLSAGINMVYDSNTEDNQFTDTLLPVVDITIGDARASQFPSEPVGSNAFN